MTDDRTVLAPTPRVLDVKAFGVTDKGRVRAANEDQFLIAELTKAMRISHTSLPEPHVRFGEERAHLFLVADGMGGHLAGETASALAVVAIEHFTLNTLKWFFALNGPEARGVLAQFQKALREADTRIVEKAAESPELTGMGTTLTVAYFLGEDLCIVHVGDSRVYVLSGGATCTNSPAITRSWKNSCARANSVRMIRRPSSASRHHQRRRRPGRRRGSRGARASSRSRRSLAGLFRWVDGNGAA